MGARLAGRAYVDLARGGGMSAPQWLAVLGVSALAGVALASDWYVAFGLLAVAVFTAVGLLRPALFLSLFLIVRPLLDQFSQVTAGADSANAAGALGLLVVGVAAVVLIAREKVVVPAAPSAALLAIGLVSALAAVQASFQLGSTLGPRPVTEMVRLLALVAVFLLAANVTTSPTRARAVFAIVGLSAVIPALWGIQELLAGAPVKAGTEIGRISGTFTGPVPYGAFLALTALVLAFGPVERIPGWLRWSGFAVMLIALTESYSRVGWVLFVLGFLVLAWPARKRLVVGLGVLLLLVTLSVPSVRERALPLGKAETESSTSSAGYESYDWRLDNWSGLLGEWKKQPVFGFGLETSTFVNPRSPARTQNVPGGGYEVHNLFVRVLVEGGIVLLAAYLLFFGVMMGRMRRLARQRWELRDAARLLYVVWGLVFFAGISTGDPFQLTALMVAVLALTGAVEGAHRVARGSQEPAGALTAR